MLVPKVVITGGPCSGKTTCLKQLSENLAHRGVRVYIATEAATVLFQHGASVTDLSSPTCQRAFQEFVIRFQIQVEDSLVNYALSTSMPSIVLCDRGTMDGAAYIDRESFLNLLQAEGMTEVEARDQRYDAVFHMVTAADGAHDFYSLENNAARSESPEEAIRVDRRLQSVWSGHPQHVIIDNSFKSFGDKLHALEDSLCRFLLLHREHSPHSRVNTVTHMISPPHPPSFPTADRKVFMVTSILLDSAAVLPILQRDFHFLHDIVNGTSSVSVQAQIYTEAVQTLGSESSHWVEISIQGNKVLRRIPLTLWSEYMSCDQGSNNLPQEYRVSYFQVGSQRFKLKEHLPENSSMPSELECFSAAHVGSIHVLPDILSRCVIK